MKRNLSLDALKWIAVITMTIDHIGFVFLPDVAELRIIGRIAFPVFAYLIAQGLHNTHNKKAYIKRLLIFACIAQLPFYLVFNVVMLNVLFTFVAGAMLCTYGVKYIPIYILLMFLVPFEFSWWGMLLIPSFYYFKGKEMIVGGLLSITLIVFAFTENIQLQLAAVFGFLVILNKRKLTSFNWPSINKYIFYWFYPAHLALFTLIKSFIF